MLHNRIRALTLIELMIVIAIVFLLMALLLPQIGPNRSRANRASCANNLKQIGTALNLYESIPAYNSFPVDSLTPDPLKSLNLLFPDFVGDARVFSCASHPTTVKLNYVGRASKNPVAANLDASMSGFGYDPGFGTPNTPHNSGDSLAVVSADILNGGATANKYISANHKGTGINVLLCSGSVEWREVDKSSYISNDVSSVDSGGKKTLIVDPDIYAPNALPVPNLDSNVRP